MVQDRKPAYTADFNRERHEELSGDIRAELARHRIMVSQLAKEMGKGKTTLYMWLLKNTTQIRYDAMMAAIKRIASQEGKQ